MNETPEGIIKAVLDGFGESYWIKEAISALLKRDVVDAARDAEILAKIFSLRADEVFRRTL